MIHFLICLSTEHTDTHDTYIHICAFSGHIGIMQYFSNYYVGSNHMYVNFLCEMLNVNYQIIPFNDVIDNWDYFINRLSSFEEL